MSYGSYTPVLVVVAYDRARSLERLLQRLEQAEYPDTAVALIISIDEGGKDDVIALAEQFAWTHGEKKVIRHATHLGLKEHILRCGDLTAEYGSIILFEDDLFVSRYFYSYASKCLNYYANDTRIAGISLYSYDVAENGFNPFVPLDDGSDVYFMQVASSWGQAWTDTQWQAFRAWFAQHPDLNTDDAPPAYLFTWRENSWKRHFVRYLHFCDKLFVFPRRSFTTNFEEPGGTAFTKGLYQVPLQEVQREYVFVSPDDSKSVYDASFEVTAACLKKWCPFLKDYEFTVDLYGTLPVSNCKTPYLLTVKEAKEEVFGFSLEMYPPVLNVINNIKGKQIKLVKKENVLTEKVAADTGYYKFTPVSEIIFQEELIERVEKVYAYYSKLIDDLHKKHTGETELLHDEIRRIHQDYNNQISALHDAYSVKLKSSVEQALHTYQFHLDYPQFALLTLVQRADFAAALKTFHSAQEQDYPRFRHLVLLVGSADGLDVSAFQNTEKCTLQICANHAEALAAAASFLHHAESDYHCWLEAGTVLLPKALHTVRDIFKRFAEVNWLKGVPLASGSRGEIAPLVKGINYRWDAFRFHNSTLTEISANLSRSAMFWKRHLWERAGGNFNASFSHIADMEYWNRLFAKDMLYMAFANLAVADASGSPSAEAVAQFSALQSSFPAYSDIQKFMSATFNPFFKRDIPLLRGLHKSQHRYPPLIRFDYDSQSFYLSEY